jgi:outer membrane protein TolC
MACRQFSTVLWFALLVSATAATANAGPDDPQSTPAAPTPSPSSAAPAMGSKLDLAQCLQLALQQHPRIAAQRASLAAVDDGIQALDALRAPGFIAPELPIRRKQAALGRVAAVAALDEAERETAYAVTRAYFTVVYAREQERVARSVVERLTALRDAAKRQLDAGARDVTNADVNRTSVYRRLAEIKRIEATEGVKRALAALREAVALESGASLDIADTRLPAPEVRPSRDEVIAAALAHGGNVIRAGVFADVASLEVEAQSASHHKRMETFAAGTDIHSTPIPQGTHGTDYRPSAIPPEMPTLLAGPREERAKHAESLQCRAAAVLEGTRKLVALEAEDAFLQWEQASLQAAEAREAASEAEQAAEDLTKDFTAGSKVRVEDVANARVLASQARSQYNEFLYRQIVALADLERITAGAFRAKLTEASAPKAEPEKAPSKEKPAAK